MDITLDKSSATEASIKIKLTEADYRPHVDKKIKEYSKKAVIKGFRPGKVPSSLIKKLYGKSIMVEELNQVLNRSITDYIKDNSLKIIGEPLPNTEKSETIDWDNQKDFEFEYEIGMIGDFEYDLKKSITRYNISVEDKTIDESIENIRLQYGQTINPESSGEGDYLYGQLKQPDGKIDRETVIALFEVDKKERSKFIGLKPEDQVEFDIRTVFVEDRLIGLVTGVNAEEAKDISGTFTFKVNKIDRRELAEMNQEFFDKVFGKDQVKSEAEFRDRIAENLKLSYASESENFLHIQIKEKLLDETPVELPSGFLKKWLKLHENNDEAVDKEFDAYSRELKWTIIMNRISEDKKISVGEEDIKNKAGEVVGNYLKSLGLQPEYIADNLDQFADNYLNAEEGKNYANLYEHVRNEKIMNAIKEQMDIGEKTVGIDEFRKIVSN